MAPLAFAFSSPLLLLSASITAWGALVGMALLSTSLAYIVFFRIVERAGASVVMLVTMMIPVPTIFLGNVVLGEVLEAREIIGALIIGAALLVIDGRTFSLLRRGQDAAG